MFDPGATARSRKRVRWQVFRRVRGRAQARDRERPGRVETATSHREPRQLILAQVNPVAPGTKFSKPIEALLDYSNRWCTPPFSRALDRPGPQSPISALKALLRSPGDAGLQRDVDAYLGALERCVRPFPEYDLGPGLRMLRLLQRAILTAHSGREEETLHVLGECAGIAEKAAQELCERDPDDLRARALSTREKAWSALQQAEVWAAEHPPPPQRIEIDPPPDTRIGMALETIERELEKGMDEESSVRLRRVRERILDHAVRGVGVAPEPIQLAK